MIKKQTGLNLYEFLGNDAFKKVDLFGLAAEDFRSTAIDNALKAIGSCSTTKSLQPVKAPLTDMNLRLGN